MKRPAVCPLMFAAFACCVVALGGEPAGPLEQIEQTLGKMRSQIRNAKVKLKGGVQGIDPRAADQPETPALSCCSSNLRHIRQASEGLAGVLEALSACHVRESRTEEVTEVELARSALNDLNLGVEAFFSARSRGEAMWAHGGLTRAYIQLERDAAEIDACTLKQSDRDKN